MDCKVANQEKLHTFKPDSSMQRTTWRKITHTGSDPMKLEQFGRKNIAYVWKKKGEAYNPKNTSPVLKHGGGILCCGDASVHPELKISSRWKESSTKEDSQSFWKTISSSQKQNWVIALLPTQRRESHITPAEELHPEDQREHCWLALTRIPLKICGVNWRPRQKTIKSGGTWEICQKRKCWDSSGGASETKNKQRHSYNRRLQAIILHQGVIF